MSTAGAALGTTTLDKEFGAAFKAKAGFAVGETLAGVVRLRRT